MTDTGDLTTFRDLIGDLVGVDPATLTAETRVGDLGLDSLLAAHLLVEYELIAEIEIDYGKITPDWIGLTLGELHAAVQTWV